MRRARAAAGLLAVCGLWMMIFFAPPARADDCKTLVKKFSDLLNAKNIQDCYRTGSGIGHVIGTVLGAAGVTIAVSGLPGRKGPKAPPEKPQKPFEPRDRDECGSEIYDIDRELNSALNEMRTAIDARTKVRMSKLDWELKACDARIKASEIRSQVAAYQSAVGAGTVNMILGMGFWTSAAILLSATGATVAIVAAWGIRGWRGYLMAQKVYKNYQGIDVGYGVHLPYSKVPQLRQMAIDAAAFADTVAEAIEQAARQYDDDLNQRKADIDAQKANADAIYQRRASTYQHCASAGNLPPGTWERPPPDYSYDGEGTVIGVL